MKYAKKIWTNKEGKEFKAEVTWEDTDIKQQGLLDAVPTYPKQEMMKRTAPIVIRMYINLQNLHCE
jgi:hypothetical protein